MQLRVLPILTLTVGLLGRGIALPTTSSARSPVVNVDSELDDPAGIERRDIPALDQQIRDPAGIEKRNAPTLDLDQEIRDPAGIE